MKALGIQGPLHCNSLLSQAMNTKNANPSAEQIQDMEFMFEYLVFLAHYNAYYLEELAIFEEMSGSDKFSLINFGVVPVHLL